MKTDQIEVFVALADEQHFGRAAARLEMSTSSFSKRLRQLEADLGIRLFTRTSRRVALTPEAKLLLDPARRLLAGVGAFHAVVAEATGGKAGTIPLLHAGNHFDFVASLVRSLRASHPGLALHYSEQPNHEIAASVLDGRASVGMCWGKIPAGLNAYCFDVLMLDTIFVPPSHPLVHRAAADLADLDGETFIRTGPDPARIWPDAAITMTVRCLPISGRDELATRIETGQGIALTSSRAVPRYRHRAIVPIPLADPSSWCRLNQVLVWRADDDSPAVRTVVETAKLVERLKAGPTTTH